MLYTDPSFASGTNGTHVYNNSGNGTVTNTRVASSDNPAGSGYALEIKTTGSASPGQGGLYSATGTAANKEYITRIVAKIPKGYNINCGFKCLWFNRSKQSMVNITSRNRCMARICI